MVMGFNTDIKHNGVVYHIQTEPRKGSGIETTVYTRGAVIHSLKSSYESYLGQPDFNDDKLKHLLEEQHRRVIGEIRAGKIVPPSPTPASA